MSSEEVDGSLVASLEATDVLIITFVVILVIWLINRSRGKGTPGVAKMTSSASARALASSSSKLALGSKSMVSSATLNSKSFLQKMERLNKDVVIFYGSQTGTAEDYSSRLATEAQQYGFDTMVVDLEDQDMSDLAKIPSTKLVIFVVATYGEGEPTDNAQEVYKYFQEEELEPGFLKNMKYVVFGLGNKTYEQYNAVGIFFDKKFEELGATRVFELGLGDDDGSLEEDFLNWKDPMFAAICSCFGKDPTAMNTAIVRQYQLTEHAPGEIPEDRINNGNIGPILKLGEQSRPPFDVKNPYMVQIVARRELMKGGDRNCLHLEFGIENTPLSYQTGDHLAIFPQNDLNLVEALGKRLQISDLDKMFTMSALDLSSSKKVPFPCPTTYRAALTHYLDIASIPRTHILKAMIEYTENPEEKERLRFLCSHDGKEAAHQFLEKDSRDLLEVLQGFPSCHPPVDLIFELLPRLQCRYYSISSSAKAHPNSIGACVVVLKYTTPTDRTAKGVCTNWLYDLNDVDPATYRVPVFVRKSTFKLPKNLSKPIIMIGPGTGVAPFRGFIEERHWHRKQNKNVGDTVLFFGCRRSDQDFLYEDELRFYEKEGTLRLFTAFSRDDPNNKVYVQKRLLEQKELVWKCLQDGGSVYVCGDARHMARDVNKELIFIAQELGKKSEQEAISYIKSLRLANRYMEDVWS